MGFLREMPKCRLCGDEGYYKPSYLKYWLCRRHYVEYFEDRVLEAIRRYKMIPRGGRVLVALSGGVDSATLLHVLKTRSEELGIQVVAFHLNLGIRGFSEKSEEVVRELAGSEGVPLIIIDIRKYLGDSVMGLARMTRRPYCALCGLIKRYLFRVIAKTLGFTHVVTGHHLDDTIQFMFKALLTRNLEAIASYSIAECLDGLCKAKPLIMVYKRDIQAYANAIGLKYMNERCPLKRETKLDSVIRDVVERLEEASPGVRITLLKSLLDVKECLGKSESLTWVNKCRICGEPSRGELCAFCKLTVRTFGKDVHERIVGLLLSEYGWLAQNPSPSSADQ